MTTEQFNRAKFLTGQIEFLRNQIDFWKKAEKFETVVLRSPKYGSTHIDYSKLNFEVIQALTVAELTKKLEALTEEFEKL